MNMKTKIFSLMVLLLLALPIVLGTQNSEGQVLGASENSQPPTGSITNQAASNSAPIPIQSRIGEIASGASEVVSENTPTSKVFKGRVIWEDNAKFSVISDKFPKGSGVQVKFNNKTYPIVIEDIRILSSDTVLVVNKDTFLKLGGNPEVDSSIEVEVIS